MFIVKTVGLDDMQNGVPPIFWAWDSGKADICMTKQQFLQPNVCHPRAACCVVTQSRANNKMRKFLIMKRLS
ncbi:MAG: hypothetical protein Q4D61_03850 [Cardiobacteriaceae bacterium]|nr:hypothetical protein [Cardiobacteriaceae bacterium]